jgi:two-component system chemotaxis response regulator CheB
MNPIRVLIVDDSRLIRNLLREMLSSDAQIEVVAEAANGQQGVEMALELRPNVVTMDLEMPVMGGLQAIEEIMASYAVPVLVISSHADGTNAYEAISRGALEVMPKPNLTEEAREALVDKIKILSGVAVIRHLRRQHVVASAAVATASRKAADCRDGEVDLVAIASSTGGPQALADILRVLPAAFPVPIVIAQHISDGFAEDMAKWLDSLCALSVCIGADQMPLLRGRVYISPSERHLAVDRGGVLQLRPRAEGDIYRPSCDCLLASVASIYGQRCLGLILTGMGHDGVAGMQAIHDKGGITMAQDEATSVIYGMNGLAVKEGVVSIELPLMGIADALLKCVGHGVQGG